jgi:hypothetical protein
MSKVSELAYDIEQLYIEGHSARAIAMILECPMEMVLAWIEELDVADAPQEDMDPFQTINS